MTLKLYGHPMSSYCMKALIALEEAGVSYVLETVDLGSPSEAERFRTISPFGMMPALEDETGLVVTEATIVVEHLARTVASASRLVPEDWSVGREVRLWDRYFDNYVQTYMQRVSFDRLRPPGTRDRYGYDQAHERLAEAYAVLDGRMAGREWVAGDFSLADCGAAPALYYARKLVPLDGHANALAYFERLEARSSVARVLQAAEPYQAFFPQEPV